MRLYYIEQELPLAQLLGKLKPLMVRLNISLVKSGGTATGPVHIISPGSLTSEGEAASLQLALPFRGAPRARGRYKSRRTEPFKCASLVQHGPPWALAESWSRFAAAVQEAGYELTGERRVVMDPATGDALKIELQLGVR
jgi:hypothetical protein